MKKILIVVLTVIGMMFLYGNSYSGENCYDLNDNQVPSGWTLTNGTGGVGGIENGKLYAKIIDGFTSLEQNVNLDVSTTSIIMKWDGEVYSSYWGQHSGIELWMKSGETVIISHYSATAYGINQKAAIRRTGASGSDNIHESTYAVEDAEYSHTVVLTDGIIKFKAVRSSDSFVLFDIEQSDASFSISEIEKIAFRVNVTTTRDSWIDNLCVDFQSACSSTCSQSDLDTQYQAGYAAGLAANGNSTSITINSDLSFSFPNATYSTLLWDINLSADFKYFGKQNDGTLLWELDSITAK